jgi:hypothetical protein
METEDFIWWLIIGLCWESFLIFTVVCPLMDRFVGHISV